MFPLNNYSHASCKIWCIVRPHLVNHQFSSLRPRLRHPILTRLWDIWKSLVEKYFFTLGFVLNLQITLRSTSIIGPCPFQLSILHLDHYSSQLVKHATSNEKCPCCHEALLHDIPQNKINGYLRHKLSHFISRIGHQIRGILRKLSKYQRLFLKTNTSLKKVDQLFHFCLSFIPWVEPFKKFPPKDIPTYGTLSESPIFFLLRVSCFGHILELI